MTHCAICKGEITEPDWVFLDASVAIVRTVAAQEMPRHLTVKWYFCLDCAETLDIVFDAVQEADNSAELLDSLGGIINPNTEKEKEQCPNDIKKTPPPSR